MYVLNAVPQGAAGGALPVAMIGVAGFCLLGPYSFLPGAFALDFGGKQAAAAASGMVDGTGYLGGVAAGTLMAWLSGRFGWGGMFPARPPGSPRAPPGARRRLARHPPRATRAPLGPPARRAHAPVRQS